MASLLIKDTTREEREAIVARSLGEMESACDGCSAGLFEMYQDYIDGKRELREINKDNDAVHGLYMKILSLAPEVV